MYPYLMLKDCFLLLRFFLHIDESSDSTSSGSVSHKATVLPPTLKRVLSEKGKDGVSTNKTTQEGTILLFCSC